MTPKHQSGLEKIRQRLRQPAPLSDAERKQIDAFLGEIASQPDVMMVELAPAKFKAMYWVNVGCYFGIGLIIAPLFLGILILGIPFALSLLMSL